MAAKFGLSQLKNPTPSKLGNAIKVFTVVGSLVLAWIGTAPFIGAKTSTIAQSILGLLIGISNGILPFFGIPNDGEPIAVDNVSSMDETKTGN